MATNTLAYTRTKTLTLTTAPTATPVPWTATSGPSAALRAYWSFNSNTGASVPEETINNHTGTLMQNAAIVDDSSPYLDLDGTFAGVHFGPIDTIFLGAGVIIAATGLWAMRALRSAPG